MKLRIFYAVALLFIAIQGALAQKVTVTGTVKDGQGDPILGTYILIKGTSKGATTNDKGAYTIEANVGDILYYSFLGMKQVEKKVTQKSSVINVVLQDDVQEIDTGLVFTGYGAPKVASKTVPSVSVVQGKALAETPNANVMDALAGRVAGMVVTTSSGRPGASSNVLIHGFNNFQSALKGSASGQDPLYIVDGAQVDGDIMSSINPNDIENITVLKDAASTSIYGSRAANGVILITTKRGKYNQPTNITISHQVGFNAITSASRKFFDNMMSPREYMDFWAQRDPAAIRSAAGVSGDTDAAIEKILKENPYNTRWDKIFFRDFVPTSRTDVSISGGTANTAYYFSLGYFKQEGSTAPALDYHRYNVNSNIDTRINKWLKAGLSLSMSYTESEGGRSSVVGGRVLALPLYTPYNPDGSRKNFIRGLTGRSTGFYHPEYDAEKHPYGSYGVDVMPIAYLTVEPIKNLVFKTQAGVQYSAGESESKQLHSFTDYKFGYETTAFTQLSQSKAYKKTFTNTLEYKFLLGDSHSFTALLGQESIENIAKTLTNYTAGQPSDGLSMLVHGNKNFAIGDNKSVSTFNSFFSRLEYDYQGRFFLDLSGRRDGSSNFGRNNRYANFWAVGAMWKLKKENFLKEVKWLTDLNLRFSTGLSGNAGGLNYSNLNVVSPLAVYQGQTGYTLSRLGNPDIRWEEQTKTSVGLNVVFLYNTSLNVEYYNRRTYDALSYRDNNSASGYTQLYGNTGGMQNQGIDLSISSRVYYNEANNLSIRPYFNFNYNQQKIVEIFDGRQSLVNARDKIGFKVGKALEYTAVLHKGVNPDTGLIEWYKPGEDKMEKQTDDSQVTTEYNLNLGQTTGKKMHAPVNGGFGWDITYGGFSLDMNFSFSIGRWVENRDMIYTENPNTFANGNLSRNVFDYWKQAGDVTRHPKITEATFVQGSDSRLIQNADFVRLKGITLSYRLPKEVIEQVGFFQGVRLYGTARNVFTITKYEGADPEFTQPISIGGYPPSRQFTFGVELKF
ncbi:SusC/RagA family TonB-linked outer membrane protein [Capnocytophaga gingivalis]|uniref:SusC/RagA family TonB-linked outer membrane protein n=1 Tax=Capnocytophaga gingivalis TaxID=1017 RepID=UPI00288AD9FD|nr:SusC/RagA family TonB-linked outer membrane protein [Capnocytophaga gingivalis]